jgi:hypothetical protein
MESASRKTAEVAAKAAPEPADRAPCKPADTGSPEPADMATPEPAYRAPCKPADMATPEPAYRAPCKPADMATPEPAYRAPCKPADMAPPKSPTRSGDEITSNPASHMTDSPAVASSAPSAPRRCDVGRCSGQGSGKGKDCDLVQHRTLRVTSRRRTVSWRSSNWRAAGCSGLDWGFEGADANRRSR